MLKVISLKEINKSFTFVDLFAGIGGFHQAMRNLNGECVFASEIDKYAIETYLENYHINAAYDVKDIDQDDDYYILKNKKKVSLPKHDVLCAGFPCQTFSKAGQQLGFKDETKGTLFFELERILKKNKTKYIILENVRNLVTHDSGRTWNIIYKHLNDIGYRLTKEPIILSPHHFGIPQLRERVIIVGLFDPHNREKNLEITFDHLCSKNECSIESIIDKDECDPSYQLTDYEIDVLNTWDEFYKGIKETIIGFPIWSEYFNKTADPEMSHWKKEFIRKNNELYINNKEFIDQWMKKHHNLLNFAPTHRKMEWQAGNRMESVWDGIIQFRTSGIRVKYPDCFPTLVAMVHVPIIGPLRRKLSVKEAAKLQSFENFIPNSNKAQAYKQFGNAVNVKVIQKCAEKLFLIGEENTTD